MSSRRFPPDRAEIGAARSFVRTELDAWGLRRCTDDLELATSEMVTNAMVHGRGDVDVTVSLSGDTVRIDVVDDGGGAALQPPHVSAGTLGGWGLYLVEAVSDAWGLLADQGRTRVWMERRVRGDGPADPRSR
jgi:anti-sigma regulatory factor (Ser/Thr protein kinase)